MTQIYNSIDSSNIPQKKYSRSVRKKNKDLQKCLQIARKCRRHTLLKDGQIQKKYNTRDIDRKRKSVESFGDDCCLTIFVSARVINHAVLIIRAIISERLLRRPTTAVLVLGLGGGYNPASGFTPQARLCKGAKECEFDGIETQNNAFYRFFFFGIKCCSRSVYKSIDWQSSQCQPDSSQKAVLVLLIRLILFYQQDLVIVSLIHRKCF